MIFNIYKSLLHKPKSTFVKVVQTQYKFYVDFKGLLYFDDSAPFIFPNSIKDKKFINQMYKKIKLNHTQTQNNYPYYAQFWGQRNFIRSAISPIIFHSLNLQNNKLYFSFQQTSDFHPQQLQIDKQGRIWHPYNQQIKGVFSNQLLTQVLDNIKQKDHNTFFIFNNTQYLVQKIN